MIVFHKHGIKEPDPMIRTTAASHCPFLQHAHTGQSLACVANGCSSALRAFHKGGGERCYSRKMADIIEKRAFRCQDAAQWSFERDEGRALGKTLAIIGMARHPCTRRCLANDFLNQCRAAGDASRTESHHGRRASIRCNHGFTRDISG